MTQLAKFHKLCLDDDIKNTCAISNTVFGGANIQIKPEPPTGLEPSTFGPTIQHSDQLSYSHHVAEPRGIEPRSMDFQSIAYTTSAKAPAWTLQGLNL